jgi:hypothetical protein
LSRRDLTGSAKDQSSFKGKLPEVSAIRIDEIHKAIRKRRDK